MEKQELEKWVPVPTSGIIEYIMDHFHTRLRLKLPELQNLFEHVVRHHGPGNPDLITAYSMFKEFAQQMEFHLLREEQILFPMLLSVDKNRLSQNLDYLVAPLLSMELDHDHDYKVMSDMQKLTQNYTAPPYACRSYIKLLKEVQSLFAELDLHIHIENDILFRRFKTMGPEGLP